MLLKKFRFIDSVVLIIQTNKFFDQNSNKCHVKHFTEGHKLHQMFMEVDL